MPSHFQISFGLKDLFRFNFEVGSPRTKTADCRHNVYDLETARRAGVIIHDDRTAPKPGLQDQCVLFTAIPIEIKYMIYRLLLTTPGIIDQAHKQLGSKETAMLDQHAPVPNLDAAILRTCRLIYSEGLPILYGQNTFQFSSAQSIRHFQNHGIGSYPLAFNFRHESTGRLQMIRCLNLELKSDFRPYNRGGNLGTVRDGIWRDWSLSFFNDDRDTFSISFWGGSLLAFPQLEKLTLDFTEWQLTETDGLLVKPFIKRLRPSEGLHELTLKGVKHEPTITQFKERLLKEDGIFDAL